MIGTVADAVEVVEKDMKPPHKDLEPKDMPVHLGQGVGLELSAERRERLDLLLVEKIQMAKVKPVVGCHLVDPRVQVHRSILLEKLGVVRGALDHVCDRPTHIVYDRTDSVFPLVLDLLEKRT